MILGFEDRGRQDASKSSQRMYSAVEATLEMTVDERTERTPLGIDLRLRNFVCWPIHHPSVQSSSLVLGRCRALAGTTCSGSLRYRR